MIYQIQSRYPKMNGQCTNPLCHPHQFGLLPFVVISEVQPCIFLFPVPLLSLITCSHQDPKRCLYSIFYRLSSEAASHAARGGGASSGCWGGSRTGLDHLDGNAATEGAGVAGVDKLDEAGVGLAGDVTGAGGISGHVDLEGVVLVDVGRTLHDANGLQGAGPGTLLGLLDLALGAGNLCLDIHGGPALASAVGVEHGLVWAGTVGGDNVQSAGDRATGGDLSQGVAGQGHGGLGARLDVIVSLLRGLLVFNIALLGRIEGSTHPIGLATSISLVALEDGGIRLGDLVLARAGNHTTLDAQSSAVATGITSCNCDLAVGGNQRGGGESNEEDLGEHFG